MPDASTQLRRLTGRTLLADTGPPPRLVVVSGGKLGVGSTTLAVNLAVALASHGSRTVLVDADQARADAAAHCGVSGPVGIADVLLGRRNIHEVLQRGPGGMQVVVGACTAEARTACTDRALARVLRQIHSLGRHADLVLLDAGSAPGDAMLRFWQAADDVLLVTTPDAAHVMDTYATIKTLLSRAAVAARLRLVVNHAASAVVAEDVHHRIDRSCQRFLGLAIPLAGWLPHDPSARAAAARGQPAILDRPSAPLAAAVDRLAELVLASPAQPHRQADEAA